MNNTTAFGPTLAAFAIGAVAGAGLALLYAPRSGAETRRLIAEQSRDLTHKAAHALDEAKDILFEKKEVVAAAVAAGKEAYREATRV